MVTHTITIGSNNWDSVITIDATIGDSLVINCQPFDISSHYRTASLIGHREWPEPEYATEPDSRSQLPPGLSYTDILHTGSPVGGVNALFTATGNLNQAGTYKITKGYIDFDKDDHEQYDGAGVSNTDVIINVVNPVSTRVKINGVWKNGIPYVKVSGSWKKGTAYTKINGSWKKGL